MLVCGECRVGKSLLCHHLSSNDSDEISVDRYIRRTGSVGFSAIPYEPTVGLDMAVLKRRLSSSTVAKIHLWDTSGDERFLGIIRSYYRCCCAAIVVVDASDPDVLKVTKKWVKDLRGQRRQDGRALVIGVFADVSNGVSHEAAGVVKYCEKSGVYYSEVKVRQNNNLEESFGTILNMVYDAYISQGIEVSGVSPIGVETATNGIHPLINRGDGVSQPSGSTCMQNGCCSIL